MKKTLLGVLLCGVIGLVGSGCNNSEPAPAAPAETAAPAPAPGAPAATAPNGSPIPANAPASVQRQMQYMNRGGASGGQMGRPAASYGGG